MRGVSSAEAMLADVLAADGDRASARNHAQRAVQAAETYGDAAMVEEAQRKASAF